MVFSEKLESKFLGYITILFLFLFKLFLHYFMIDNLHLRDSRSEENKIEEIMFRAVNLFEKTGLKDLAEKWDTILKMYAGKKELSNPSS